jgi:hypothetical protein
VALGPRVRASSGLVQEYISSFRALDLTRQGRMIPMEMPKYFYCRIPNFLPNVRTKPRLLNQLAYTTNGGLRQREHPSNSVNNY